MTPLDSLTAQLACSFCRNEIGRLGLVFNERVRVCPRCAPQVKAAIEAQMAVGGGVDDGTH